MAPSRPATGRTLLNWVNTFPLDSKVESLAELSDGFVLSKMLEDFDPKYAVYDLENNTSPSKWLAKKKTLEAVQKSLLRYLQHHCEDSVDLGSAIDFNAIAEHNDEKQTVKLLKQFLLAAVSGNRREAYVKNIMTRLDGHDQEEIARIIQEVTTSNAQETLSNVNDAELPVQLTQHLELAIEADFAKLTADHEALKKKNADLYTRLENLQDSHDDLLVHSQEADRELQALRGSNDGNQAHYITELKNRIQEQNDLIAQQEQQIETDRMVRERQDKELVSLRPAAQRLVEREDEVKELKTENATLSKKANMVDHFKGKLELQKIIEKENDNLRFRVDVLEANQTDFDKVHQENEQFQRTIREYEKRFNNYENEHVELTTQRKVLEEDLRMQEVKVQSLQAKQQHDEDFISSLQEQIRTNTAGPPPSPDSPRVRSSALSLGEELEQSGDSDSNHALIISRLRAENQLLKSGTAGTTAAQLRSELEDAERVRKQLEENLRDLTEKHALGQMQLNSMLSSSSDEKNEAVIATRKLYLETNQELSATKSKLADIEAELSTRDRELLAARADLAAIDREEMDALEDLKSTNQIITTSFKNELLEIQSKHKALITDHEQQKSHLIDALLAKDRLSKDLTSKGPVDTNGDDTRQKAQAKEDEDARRTLQEQIISQDSIIQDLQRRLKIAEGSSPDAQKAKNEAIIKNLTRENALISSAWYDLTSRLQSNHVVLQRRQDAPRSWLNKQRQMVYATPRR